MTDYIVETIKAGILETLAMTFFSSVFSYLFGLPLGILLYATSKGRIMENKPVNFVLGLIVNIGRSLPFLILLVLLIVCAIAVNVTRNLLQAVVIFMSYSSIMCIVWILLESPDLAVTEAAVGAGISGTLFLMTLKKIRADDADRTIRHSAEEDQQTDPKDP